MDKFDTSRYEFGLQGEEKVANYYKQHGYDVATCKEHFGSKWSPTIDKQNGDLFVYKNGKTYQIDVKRARDTPERHYEFGTISYCAEYDDAFQSKPNSWYALLDDKMPTMCLLKASKLHGLKPRNSKFWMSFELKGFIDKEIKL